MTRSEKLAWKIRRHVVEMTHLGNSSHIGSALSITDIVAVLYSEVLHYDITNPKWSERDRFVLSKGHAGTAVYAALAESGFFDIDILNTHYQNGSCLSGHVSHKGVPGVEMSTGSLGHGICVSEGMALAGKMDRKKYRVFTIIGDGECDEGSVWEAALFGNQFKLDNFTVIIDHNKLQSMDTCEHTMDLLDLGAKWQAFGWNVKTADGHNHQQLIDVLTHPVAGMPNLIIANTIKGKGISFMENQVLWHYRAPQGEDYIKAVKELEDMKR